MTAPTFAPPVDPSTGTSDSPEAKVLTADFGDGYVQSGPDGINNIRSVLSLKWEAVTNSEADQIIGFLAGQRGSDPFFYALPGGSPVLFTCNKWSRNYRTNNLQSVTATLRQSFNIV